MFHIQAHTLTKKADCPTVYFIAKCAACQGVFKDFMAFMVLIFPISPNRAKKVFSRCLLFMFSHLSTIYPLSIPSSSTATLCFPQPLRHRSCDFAIFSDFVFPGAFFRHKRQSPKVFYTVVLHIYSVFTRFRHQFLVLRRIIHRFLFGWKTSVDNPVDNVDKSGKSAEFQGYFDKKLCG